MFRTKSKLLVGAMALALSVGGLGAAYAATDDQSTEQTVQQKAEHGKRFGKGKMFVNSEALLSLLNVTADDLQAQLKAGKSLAEIAKAQGVSEEEVINLLAKQQEEKLAEAVKAGELTQEQADKMTAAAGERIKSFVENGYQERGFGPGSHLKDNEELLKLLNLDADQLEESLKEGKSLAEVAEAQGVAKEDLISLLVKQSEESIKNMVERKHGNQENTVAE